jgi:hypothetical protein
MFMEIKVGAAKGPVARQSKFSKTLEKGREQCVLMNYNIKHRSLPKQVHDVLIGFAG